MTDIGRLRELEEKATPAPWRMGQTEADCGPDIWWLSPDDDDSTEATLATLDTGEHDNEANATFIREFRNAAPHLLSEIETLRAENERLKAALQPFADIADKPSPPLSDYHRVSISLGDCRRAASALAAYDQGKVT